MDYSSKKVLILGLGLNHGGLGAAKFFARHGATVTVTDLKSADVLKSSLDELAQFPDILYVLGEHKYEDIDWADLIIRNQGVRPDNPLLTYAYEKGKQVEMDIGIFLQHVGSEQLIGITGTKGKSTTSSLIWHAVKIKDPQAILAGNIGSSVLDALDVITDTTTVVLELSSFQLEAFLQHGVSPRIAVITNILEDHLNYYGTMDRYIAAKRIIAQFQKPEDVLCINEVDHISTNQEFLLGLHGSVTFFSGDDLPEDFIPHLPGAHNKANYAAALAVVRRLGIADEEALSAMNQFTGVPFRLELIKTWRGVTIYNDTAATSPAAAIQALHTFPNCILIAGGVNKNLHYVDFAAAIDNFAKEIYFLAGDATNEIVGHMQSQDKIRGVYNDFETILNQIKENIHDGDVIILSPGAASFNLFQNEFDRGRKFNQAVNNIF